MPRKAVIQSLKLNEISGVDNPAQEGARVSIMKRNGIRPQQKSLFGPADDVHKGYGDLADVLTSETDGHQHGIDVDRRDNAVAFYVSWAQGPEDENGHSHPIVRNAQGQYELGVVSGHTHTIDQEGIASAVLALVTKDKGDSTMPNDNDPTKETLAEALKVANAVIALKADERAHFDTLDEDAKKNFILKSADDRKADIDAVKQAKTDSDPVEYTTADGVEIRKSAGVALITALKSNDDMRKENAELRKQREQETLEKRAETDLKYLPGDVKVRAAMLKAVDGIEDETQRTAAHNALKAQNKAMAEAFKTQGHVGGQSEPGSPDEELHNLAKAYAKDKNVSEAVAESEVLKTAQGQELYNKSVN